MLFKKKETPIYVKLTEKSVEFIKNVVIKELGINTRIGVKEICDIEDWIYELENIQYDEDGKEVLIDDLIKEKIARAQELLAELMSIWGGENTTEDLDDLNSRLGLT